MNNKRKNESYFEEYYDRGLVNTKLRNGKLYEGKLKVKGTKWFIESDGKEIYFENEKDRNRAFEGDNVVVERYNNNSDYGNI